MKTKRRMSQENDIRRDLREFIDYFDAFYFFFFLFKNLLDMWQYNKTLNPINKNENKENLI